MSRIEVLLKRLAIPRSLNQLGVRREQLPQIVASSFGNSMDGNPVRLSAYELTRILEAAF
jgi:alcohol dehydrogenase class IV